MDRDNIKEIERYQSYLEQEAEFHNLDQNTKKDLDFDSIFWAVDRTSSKIGKQYLYHLLSTPKYDEDELKAFDRTVEQVAGNSRLHKKIERPLKKLNSRDLYWLPAVFLKPLSKTPKWFVAVPLLSLCMLAALIGAVFFAGMAFKIAALAMFTLNAVVFWSHKTVIDIELRSIKQLGKLAAAGDKLLKLDIQSIDGEELKRSVSAVSKISKWIASITIEANHFDPISTIAVFIMDNLKAAFLYDIMVLYFNLRQIEKHQREIHSVFISIGYVDAAASVASFRQSNEFTKPAFISGCAQMSITEACHPLVKDCVPNSISISSKGILVTGSNMSGKTTFIKVVAVNALLAQSLYTTLTREYRAPFLDIYASIGVADDINRGKSYYLAELEAIRVLVQASDGGRPCLFIIDELFKGTNTLERVAAAKELLQYLAEKKKHVILMATHDIELAGMLKDYYELYYFQEQVEHLELSFDYKIKRGVLKTGNAIRLLELVGFPESIVSAAMNLSEQLEQVRSTLS